MCAFHRATLLRARAGFRRSKVPSGMKDTPVRLHTALQARRCGRSRAVTSRWALQHGSWQQPRLPVEGTARRSLAFQAGPVNGGGS